MLFMVVISVGDKVTGTASLIMSCGLYSHLRERISSEVSELRDGFLFSIQLHRLWNSLDTRARMLAL